jgi:hypothetical protein
MVGPALETFLQAFFLLVLIAVPVVFLLRKPLLRFWNNLREADKRQCEVADAREQERKGEEVARQRALNELSRDCNLEDIPTETQAKKPARRR